MITSAKNSLINALRENIFHNALVRKEELNELVELFITRTYPRRKTIVSAGERWDKAFFIHQGIIRLFYTDSEGREFNKGFFSEHDLVWPIAPSARAQDSLFSIAALEDLTVSVCRFAQFYSWLKLRGYWEKFALPYAERFAEDKFRREYEFLLNSAADRYRNFCAEYPRLVERIPDYHLASYLGVTNVTLSRIKKSTDFNVC